MDGYRSLTENQKVEYTTRQGPKPKGPQANQVRASLTAAARGRPSGALIRALGVAGRPARAGARTAYWS
jgi:'Cold-shock' DNA-binding domain